MWSLILPDLRVWDIRQLRKQRKTFNVIEALAENRNLSDASRADLISSVNRQLDDM
jgi:hypothetical protein